MNKHSIDSIITGFFKGEATPEEIEKLIDWLNEDKNNRLQYFTAKRIWLEHQSSTSGNDLIDRQWERIKLRLGGEAEVAKSKYHQEFKHKFKKWAAAATILMLMASTAFLGIKVKQLYDIDRSTHEIHVPFGSRTSLTLADGTKVWLNSGSNLAYNSDFGRNRIVYLSGEAFFDVKRHENSIFTVNTQDLNIKVLGTQFNVKSYPEERFTETTLVSGKVEIDLKDKAKQAVPIVLTSNQKMIYEREEIHHTYSSQDTAIKLPESINRNSTSNRMRIAKINNPLENTSWKEGKLIFTSETLKDLASKLERFYNVEILFQDESIKALRYTGTLDEVTIEEFLKAISSASSIKYEINKNKVILSKKAS